jgi:hypothetical protein
MAELKISPPPFPNREEYPFTASVRYRGMVIDVENLDGSVREGTNPNGKRWRTKFKGCHYGELRGSLGTDGDKLDIYIKSNPDDGANKAYIIHQNHPRTHPTKAGQYDEDKVVLGVSSLEAAKELYLRHYDRKDYLRSVTEMPIEKFKRVALGENRGEKVASETTAARAKELGSQIGIDWDDVDFPVEQLRLGIDVEREHGTELGHNTDVGADKDPVAARIAWAHLKELPDYYTRLAKMEEEGEKALRKKSKDLRYITESELREYGRDPEKVKRAAQHLVDRQGKPLGSAFIRTRMREGGNPMDIDKIKEVASKCDTPGKKIRSKGKGRGAGVGRGHGPRGVPIGEKAMNGKEEDMSKKSEVTEAYRAGAQAALDEYLKEAAQKGFRTVLKKLPGAPVTKAKIPSPPKVPAVQKVAQGPAPALNVNPGGGYGFMGFRGQKEVPIETQAVAGNLAIPNWQERMSGQTVASPQVMNMPQGTPSTTANVQQQQPMVAQAGNKNIPRG